MNSVSGTVDAVVDVVVDGVWVVADAEPEFAALASSVEPCSGAAVAADESGAEVEPDDSVSGAEAIAAAESMAFDPATMVVVAGTVGSAISSSAGATVRPAASSATISC